MQGQISRLCLCGQFQGVQILLTGENVFSIFPFILKSSTCVGKANVLFSIKVSLKFILMVDVFVHFLVIKVIHYFFFFFK